MRKKFDLFCSSSPFFSSFDLRSFEGESTLKRPKQARTVKRKNNETIRGLQVASSSSTFFAISRRLFDPAGPR